MFETLPRLAFAGFALAGLAFAAGPIIIHLLNRRRFRVVSWAAMDFLREALQRNRRILQLRDLLLLLLRCAAIILFGLALAQPYISVDEEKYDASQPLHAVLVVDNSMSMGYQDLDGTLLDRAKERAEQFIDDLPRGSRISVVPLCGSREPISSDPYRTPDDATAAVQRIELVDRAGSLDLAANKARRACEAEPQLAKRIVLFGDQQRINWRDKYSPEDLQQMPPMQLVEVAPQAPENTWIEDVEVQDGIADVETPATIVVRLGHEGPAVRNELPVTLTVGAGKNAVDVNAKTVSLEPGTRNRELTFRHRFDNVQPEPGNPVFVPVRVSLTPDRLPADDEYDLMVPVVAALPVVFIDQLSAAREDPVKGRIGETFHLRRLLAPVTRRQDGLRQLVRIRHINIDGMPAADLKDRIQDARLVVIGGLQGPSSEAVEVLREYVEQGGQLIVAAGGQFDPVLWQQTAWLDGAGILPAPLTGDVVGRTPEEAGPQIDKWFALKNDNDSLLAHQYFQLAGNSPEDLDRLYAEPLFFKAVRVDVSPQADQQLLEAETERLDEELAFFHQAMDRRQQRARAGEQDEAEQAAQADDARRLQEVRPEWLLFGRDAPDVFDEPLADDPAERQRQIAALAARSRFRVLAEFDNGLPFLVQRSIGRGRVLFVSTGVLPEWNTMAKNYAWAVFDRILRSMIESTLSPHNYPPEEEIAYPVGDDRDVQFALYRPGEDGSAEPVDAGFVGSDRRAVTVRNALQRGVYRLAAYNPKADGQRKDGPQPQWETRFAVRGEPRESDLTPLTRETFDARQLGDRLRWVGPGETISLAGAQVRGQDWWKYLILAVLLLLLFELILLAWPAYRRKREELATP